MSVEKNKAKLELSSKVETGKAESPQPPPLDTPSPQEATITEVKSQAKAKTNPAPKSETAPAETKTHTTKKTTTSSSTKTSSRSSGYGDYLDDFSRQYRGASPAVIESIITHPVLFSRSFQYEPRSTKLSARSKRVIRDSSDLALVSPGLKGLLEVQYLNFPIFGCSCQVLLEVFAVCVTVGFFAHNATGATATT